MVTVTVNPLPSVVAAITKTLFCKLDTQTLSISGSAISHSINSIFTPTQSLLTYSVSGGVLITIIGEDINGCKASGSISFLVGNCTVGLDDLIKSPLNSLNIYPNPNKGEFYIDVLDQNNPVNIFNEIGMLIRSEDTHKSQKIPIAGLSPGIYLITNGTHKFKVIVYD